jgi:hypothetical protein
MADEIRVTRKEAAQMIEAVRTILARLAADTHSARPEKSCAVAQAEALASVCTIMEGKGNVGFPTPIPPLTPCDGEAHGTPADHCGVCAPRWGLVGPTVRVT